MGGLNKWFPSSIWSLAPKEGLYFEFKLTSVPEQYPPLPSCQLRAGSHFQQVKTGLLCHPQVSVASLKVLCQGQIYGRWQYLLHSEDVPGHGPPWRIFPQCRLQSKTYVRTIYCNDELRKSYIKINQKAKQRQITQQLSSYSLTFLNNQHYSWIFIFFL